MLSKILSANYTDFAVLFYLNRNLLVEFIKIKIVIYSILHILTSMRGFLPLFMSSMAAKMAAKKVAKTRPWNNILRWEHTNSFTRHLKDYKNITYKNISYGCMGIPSSYSTNLCSKILLAHFYGRIFFKTIQSWQPSLKIGLLLLQTWPF